MKFWNALKSLADGAAMALGILIAWGRDLLLRCWNGDKAGRE